MGGATIPKSLCGLCGAVLRLGASELVHADDCPAVRPFSDAEIMGAVLELLAQSDELQRAALVKERTPNELASALVATGAKLLKAEALLARCEPNLPRHLVALLEDVRAFLGIDSRGFRTAGDKQGLKPSGRPL